MCGRMLHDTIIMFTVISQRNIHALDPSWLFLGFSRRLKYVIRCVEKSIHTLSLGSNNSLNIQPYASLELSPKVLSFVGSSTEIKIKTIPFVRARYNKMFGRKIRFCIIT